MKNQITKEWTEKKARERSRFPVDAIEKAKAWAKKMRARRSVQS